MAEVRIVCINKPNRESSHEAISRYGWRNAAESGVVERQGMVNYLEDGNKAYVVDNFGNRIYCYLRESASGTKFLQTYADSKFTNNLLSLAECPLE